MDNENKESTSVLEKKVGNVESEKKTLIPARVTIVGIREKTEKPDGTKYKVPLVNMLCKHPEKDDPIAISKIKLIVDDKVITKTLWVVLDKEENIQMESALDDILKFAKVDSLSELEGKEFDTVVESKESSFLCLKLFN